MRGISFLSQQPNHEEVSSVETPLNRTLVKKCSFYEDGVEFSLQDDVMRFESGQYPFGQHGKHVMFERLGVTRE